MSHALGSSRPPLFFVKVDTEYRDPLASRALEVGIDRERVDDLSSAAVRAAPGLCVTQLKGDSDAELERLTSLLKSLGSCPLVVLAEDVSIDTALRLIRLGVADVVEVPRPRDELGARVLGAYREPSDPGPERRVVGESAAMILLREEIRQAGEVPSTVLLRGETGTGKGLVARCIHQTSGRRQAPFIHVDCAALSPNLIESELFGHEKGAFTGAGDRRTGRFELAERGTIFLDEIGDLDASLQTKLLRVLEDRRYERVGGTRTLVMNARVIAATSQDLHRAVADGRFRIDLYFRLDVLKLAIPPLREHTEDIPLLVDSGLGAICDRLGLRVPELSDEFLAHLTDHRWPGNVRELLNLLERILVRTPVGRLEAEDLDGLLDWGPGASAEPASDDHGHGSDERAMIEAALRETGGVVMRAARRLGVPRGTLRYRIRKHDLGHLIPKD